MSQIGKGIVAVNDDTLAQNGGGVNFEFFLCVFRQGGCYKINMTPDSELLANFARTNSQEAFAELVRRHVNLVYSAALRQVQGDAHLAQDVAQLVFADLARKAGSLARRESLTGWLYTSAHFAAAKIIRTETRRRDRENKFMREATTADATPEADWEMIRPALDDTMHDLKESDREVILLRYFENRPFAEIGARLGLNENAARMRVERALERLRDVFARRGITVGAVLATVISANAVQLAPTGLAATLTSAAMLSAGTGTFTLFKFMTAIQLKLGVSALVVAGAATAFVFQHQAQEKLRGENEALRQQMAQLQADNQTISNQLAATGDSRKLTADQLNELLKLRGEVGILRLQDDQLKKMSAEIQQLRAQVAARPRTIEVSESDYFRAQDINTVNAAKQIGLAMTLYAQEHGDQYPTNLDELSHGAGNDFGYVGTTNFAGGVKLDGFELMNVGVSNLIRFPELISIREKVPRKSPTGEWHRIYGLADGSVQTETSATEDFGTFEKPRLFTNQ